MKRGALRPPPDGPMGWVESQDGEIRPSIEVDCDRISAMVWQTRGTLPMPLSFVRSVAHSAGYRLNLTYDGAGRITRVAAVVCFGPLGWQWAVAEPRAQPSW